jgi:hypothetical protein
MVTIDGKEIYLSTAGGRITCLRCTAKSTRSGVQCRRPALTTSRTQKCQYHGGRNSGPKTQEGRRRIGEAHLKHGEATQEARQEDSLAAARLRRLEDAMYVLGMTTAPRTRGRKSQHYLPVRTVDDIRKMVIEAELHLNRGSLEGG